MLRVTEVTHITGTRDGMVLEQGTVRGVPLGSGTITIEAHIAASGAIANFTVQGPRGSVHGVARIHLRVNRRTVYYDGTAVLTGGSGGYRRVSAPRLTVTGSGDVAGTRTVWQVTGVEYD